MAHSVFHRGYAYAVLQTVQMHGVCSTVYGIVHYKEPLKSFDMSRAYNSDFGLPSVVISP